MKRLFAFAAMAFMTLTSHAQLLTPSQAQETHYAKYLTTQEFSEKVHNLTQREWKYLGQKPCLIDFYAVWCGPCKRLAPTLEEVAKEYDGKVIVYKVDVDKEKQLAAAFNVRSIPTLLFVPMNDMPQVIQGAPEKAALEEFIDVLLLGQKPRNLKVSEATTE